jgi:hypothetical protein
MKDAQPKFLKDGNLEWRFRSLTHSAFCGNDRQSLFPDFLLNLPILALQ